MTLRAKMSQGWSQRQQHTAGSCCRGTNPLSRFKAAPRMSSYPMGLQPGVAQCGWLSIQVSWGWVQVLPVLSSHWSSASLPKLPQVGQNSAPRSCRPEDSASLSAASASVGCSQIPAPPASHTRGPHHIPSQLQPLLHLEFFSCLLQDFRKSSVPFQGKHPPRIIFISWGQLSWFLK